MREILTILKSDIKSKKSSFLSIMLLMVIVSFSVITICTVYINAQRRDRDAIREGGFGDVFESFNDKNVIESGTSIDDLRDKVKKFAGTKDVKVSKALNCKIKDINGKESDNSMYILDNGENNVSYKFYSDSNLKSPVSEDTKLEKGEIAVPISYKTLYNCKIGDKIILNDSESSSVKVKYFIEDPLMGASVMGVKTLILSHDDFKSICKNSANSDYICSVFHISKKSNNESQFDFEKSLNKETNINSYAIHSMTMDEFNNYMLMVVKIFCGILLFFSVILLVGVLVIMGHNIKSNIELNFENIGIMKSIGFTVLKLKLINILEYLLSSVLGIIISIPVSLLVISNIEEIISNATGLVISNNIQVCFLSLILFMILLVIVFYIILKINKIKKITPINAISGGNDSIYFKSVLEAPINKKFMDFFVAYRQLISNKKQYISIFILSAILVFFLGLVSATDTWMGKDGENLSKIFSSCNSDITVNYEDGKLQSKIENIIKEHSKIKNSFYLKNKYVMINDSKVYCYVIDDPKLFDTVTKGRTCKYDNEILITEYLAKQLNVSVGSSVDVCYNGKKASYIISGFYQCANDMGSNFAMNIKGFNKISNTKDHIIPNSYVLENSKSASKIVDDINNKYDKSIVQAQNNKKDNLFDTIESSVNSISIIIYAISTLFIIISIFTMCGKVFESEKKDYGIYKSIGFTSSRLRLQFAIRFSIVAIIGSLFGILIYAVLSKPCISLLLSSMGITNNSSSMITPSLIVPVVFMVIVFFIFAFLISRRIKKVKVTILSFE